jgi:SAM-dependent methyltransferase
MQLEFLSLLQCPHCRKSFRLEIFHQKDSEIFEGILTCPQGEVYPIVDSIPRVIPGASREFAEFFKNHGIEGRVTPSRPSRLIEKTKKSFGREWLTYEVQNIEEDIAYFLAKSGFTLEELRDRYVLDAGCGGGRYTYIAARAGAKVVAVDVSKGVEKTRELIRGLPNVHIIQADLMELPLRENMFDYIYSLGVLHHTPDTEKSFRSIIKHLAPEGRIAIWVYPKWSRPREITNTLLRSITTRLPHLILHYLSCLAVPLGFLYLKSRDSAIRPLWWLMKGLAAMIPFSTHPQWRIRVCDTFDWYAPPYQWHHTEREVEKWFYQGGLVNIKNLSTHQILYYHHQGRGINFSGSKKKG